MRKVANKEAVRRLSDRGFQANKLRNSIAAVAIALTAMLFTAHFTIGIGALSTFQMQTARQVGGDAHGVLKNLTKEEYKTLKEHPLIKVSMPCELVADYVRNPEFLKRHVEARYCPKNAYTHSFIEIQKGKSPKKADEILLDETSMELLGLKKEPGQKVTLQLQIRQYDETITKRTFTVTGITRSDLALNVGFAIVSKALSNLGRSKGKTTIIIASLSLAIILLNSVFTITHSFDMDKYLQSFMKPDFIIGNAKYFGMDYYRGRNLETIDEENLTESFIEYCQGLKGYEDGGRLYGAGSFVGVKQKGITIPSGIEQDSSGMPGEYYGKEFIPFTDKGAVRKDRVLNHPGDKVTLTYKDQNGEPKEKEVTVLSVIKEDYWNLTTRMSDYFPYYMRPVLSH